MKKIEFLIDEPEVYEKKMKSVIELLGKKDAKLLHNELKTTSPSAVISEMINNVSILSDFIILKNNERKKFLLKYPSAKRKYIIFNSWLFLRYMKYISIEFGSQDNFAEEYKLENQPINKKIFSFYSTSLEVLNKLIENFFIPFS